MICAANVTMSIESQGLCSLSRRTSYRKISKSQNLEVGRSLWNLTDNSAAGLPIFMSNFRAIRPLFHSILPFRDFTIIGIKTSYRLVNRSPCCFLTAKSDIYGALLELIWIRALENHSLSYSIRYFSTMSPYESQCWCTFINDCMVRDPI